jgi:predicted N-acetyltransferase YhbS
VEIRPYLESDEAAVAALWREVFPAAPAWNQPEANIQRKLAVQRELFLVAVLDSEVVGTAMGGGTTAIEGGSTTWWSARGTAGRESAPR